MTLRRRVLAYLILIHLLLAAGGIVLLGESRLWLYAVEGVFAASMAVSIILYRHIFRPTDMPAIGAEFLKEQDFNSRFRLIGHPEVDVLMRLYNSIAESLQREHIRSQEQEHFLGKLLNASPAGIITCDLDRRIDLVNPAAERILQFEAAVLKGQRLADVGSRLTDELARLAIGSSAVIPQSGRRQMKCWKSQFLDRGFPREFVMFEELTDELRRIEKASYERLIRLMSHEVNNSIGAANSLLHSCLHYKDQIQAGDRADFESALRVVISRTEHLGNFMKVFGDLVRLPPPQLQEYDIVMLLRDTVRLFEPDLARRAIEVEWELGRERLPVRIDVGQMGQVFVNILKNSIEAIDQQGRIHIGVGESSGHRFVYVDDTGSGLTEEIQGKLFTPFFTTKAGGQGVGLTLASEVLRQHDFEFSLENQLGWTRFRIHFD